MKGFLGRIVLLCYCKAEKLYQEEILLNRVRKQGLVPKTRVYKVLIDGPCTSARHFLSVGHFHKHLLGTHRHCIFEPFAEHRTPNTQMMLNGRVNNYQKVHVNHKNKKKNG
ncbi:hypothetical protein AAHE18_04G198400 [Arachis hypogaea]